MFIYSNLATSLDGKIAVYTREHFPIGTETDLRHMIDLRRDADAILFGATTLRGYRKACRVKGKDPQPCNVILSHSLEGVDPEWDFFKAANVKRVLFVSKMPEPHRLKEFEATSQVILLNSISNQSLASQIIRHLEGLGISKLLIEGGGGVIWDFAQENLIDEYHVTLTPKILGGVDAPTLVEGKGFKPDEVLNLKLKECKAIGDELFLVYSKTHVRGRIAQS